VLCQPYTWTSCYGVCPGKLNRKFFKIVWPCIVIYSLWIKPTDALSSNFITGISTLHVSGSLSAHHQEFFQPYNGIGTFYAVWWPSATRRILRCTAKNSWWRAQRLPETCRFVIPIKLELSASVAFIHKEWIEGIGLKKSCSVANTWNILCFFLVATFI
jgi:hypothetical protein